jgi:hypothetical protein
MTSLHHAHESQISPRMYCEDYVSFGIKHRVLAVKTLLTSWHTCEVGERVLLGAKVLHEYGGAIEELFAFTYAVYHQCNAPVVKGVEKEVFFDNLFDYGHKELWKFAKCTEFKDHLRTHLRLPKDDLMSEELQLEIGLYRKAVSAAEETLEGCKVDFFERKFQDIYNKLKHPFLVLSPGHNPSKLEYVLNVLTKKKSPDVVATVMPVEVTLDNLRKYELSIKQITHDTITLIKLMLARGVIVYES